MTDRKEYKIKLIYGDDMFISESEAASDLENLSVHLKNLARIHPSQTISIKWIDEEGDPILISTQEELDEALRLYSLNKDNLFEVHVFLNKPKRPGALCEGENVKMYRKGAKRLNKFYHEKGHYLHPKRFNPTATCPYCQSRIWGLGQQGFKCKDCKMTLHKRCIRYINHECGQDPSRHGISNPIYNPTRVLLEDAPDRPPRKPVNLDTTSGSSMARGKIGIDDFALLSVIGRGSYAKVFQVEYKPTKKIYAMKVIKKEMITNEDDIEWVQTEKQVFEQATNHPFLVGLHSSFQTPSRLIFVIEFVNGGDLMFYMQRQIRLPEDYAKFYAAEIAIALNYLHEHEIIYRDLKLDNVLMDLEGHIKLTDYGMCKSGIKPGDTTKTFCGTPNYIAPEILKSEPYGFSVDWWALGVLMFEMMVGRSPWEGVGQSDNPQQNTEQYLFQVILHRPIRFPRFTTIQANNILKAFLTKEPENRLGTMPKSNFYEIMSNPFFSTINWSALELKQISPPYRPEIKNDLDLRYFDPTFTDEQVCFSPDDEKAIAQLDQTEFDGFEYINPLLFTMNEQV